MEQTVFDIHTADYISLLLIRNVHFIMFSDNVPTVCLAQWPLEASMWDGDVIAGPVPTLFTEDIANATAAILKVKIWQRHSVLNFSIYKNFNDTGKHYLCSNTPIFITRILPEPISTLPGSAEYFSCLSMST